ncbi:MAG: signal peptidase I [Propionibacteriaceae bacterium]|jgi:signal peptidase|nr:signal peptidase I [Propionibacteriaceae bacterium]
MFNKILRIIQTVILGLICLAGSVSVLVVATVLIFRLHAVIVISGSMEPTLPVGSIVFSRPVSGDQIEVGDIVSVPQSGSSDIVTHRVLTVTPTGDGQVVLTMRGDANKLPDISPYTVSEAYLYIVDVPELGKVIVWAQNNRLAAGLILLGLLLFSLQGRSRVSVRLPDGQVIHGLNKREANRLVALWSSQPPVPGRHGLVEAGEEMDFAGSRPARMIDPADEPGPAAESAPGTEGAPATEGALAAEVAPAAEAAPSPEPNLHPTPAPLPARTSDWAYPPLAVPRLPAPEPEIGPPGL